MALFFWKDFVRQFFFLFPHFWEVYSAWNKDPDGQAHHSGRQRQNMTWPALPAGRPAPRARAFGQLLCLGLLPRLYRRRPLCKPALKGTHDQLLCLRLQLLRQPQVQRYPPCHLHTPGAGRADHGILPPQLTSRGCFFPVRCWANPDYTTERMLARFCACCGVSTVLAATSTPRLFRAQARNFCSSWGIWPTV